ncbi:terminase small subunit [Salinicola corii]|uniref:terminase small subunit n=1 Tax=Salinicola corii TaxID=2606937 RepID=UPI001CA88CA6|nr:terminase small subunit [Salinicola corii]
MASKTAAAVGLTAKQSLFVDEYLKDLNATQAAIRDGYCKKAATRIGPNPGLHAGWQGRLIGGRLVAAVLGAAPTPEAVGRALQIDPQALTKVRAAESGLEQEGIEADIRRQETVNETIRAELQADSWYKSGTACCRSRSTACIARWTARTTDTEVVRRPTLSILLI